MPQFYDGMSIRGYGWMKGIKEICTGREVFTINHATGRLEKQHEPENFVNSSYSSFAKKSQSVAAPEENYEPVHPRSISLSSCVDDGVEDGTLVFTHEVSIPLDFKNPKLHSKPLPLYHAHVLWSYVVELDKTDLDDVFIVKVVSEGTRLTRCQRYQFNDVPGLNAPKRISISLQCNRLLEERAWTPFPDGSSARPITKQELLAAGDVPFVLTARFAVPRAYFDLPAILDSTKPKRPAASSDTHGIVAQILGLKKPPGADWEITGGSDTRSRVYKVHQTAFDRYMENTWAQIEKMNRGKRVRITGYGDAAIRMIIRICYGVDVPLPGPNENIEEIVVDMCKFFGERPDTADGDFKGIVIPHWQREICRKALALDTRNPSSSSIVELLSLLHIIWEAPIGYFPVAKRVAIGVLADMVHLSAYRTIDRFERELITPALKFLPNKRNVSSIIKSMKLHLAAISMVDKRMEIRVENEETKLDTTDLKKMKAFYEYLFRSDECKKIMEKRKKDYLEKMKKEEAEIESFRNNTSPWTECTIL